MSFENDDTTVPTTNMDIPRKPESSLLTDCQISDILKVLEDTRRVLDKYIVIFEDDPVVDTNIKLTSWWGRHCWPHRRRKLYRYIAIISAGLQFVSLLTVTILDSWPKQHDLDKEIYIASSCSMVIIQFVNVLLLTLSTGHVMKMMYRQTLNFWALSHTYIATTLMFAGVFTTSHFIQSSSWKVIDTKIEEKGEAIEIRNETSQQVFVTYARFLLMSVYTATLTGSSNVVATEWFNYIFVTIQMLLSFFFFTAFVGLSLSPRLIQLTSTLQAMTTSAGPQRRYSTFTRPLHYNRQTPAINNLSTAPVDDAPLPASILPPQRRRSTPAMDNVMKHLGLQLQQQYFTASHGEDVSSHC